MIDGLEWCRQPSCGIDPHARLIIESGARLFRKEHQRRVEHEAAMHRVSSHVEQERGANTRMRARESENSHNAERPNAKFSHTHLMATRMANRMNASTESPMAATNEFISPE